MAHQALVYTMSPSTVVGLPLLASHSEPFCLVSTQCQQPYTIQPLTSAVPLTTDSAKATMLASVSSVRSLYLRFFSM